MYQIDFNHPSSIYFVGIGGISMSGLAEILKDAGFRVSGSDRSKSPLTETLERKGINVFYGQRAGNITDDIDCVVFTSAIHKDNPEYVATMEKGIPHLTRAQLLGEIMQNYKTPIAISGTHGKTTTTIWAGITSRNWTPCRCRSICAITSTMRPTGGTSPWRKAASSPTWAMCGIPGTVSMSITMASAAASRRNTG